MVCVAWGEQTRRTPRSALRPASSRPRPRPPPGSPGPRPLPAPRLTPVSAPAEGQLAFALPVEAALQLRAAGRAGDHVGLEPRTVSGPFRAHPPCPVPARPPPEQRRWGWECRLWGCELCPRTGAEAGAFTTWSDPDTI